MFAEGLDRAPRPCTYSNKCLVNFVENPLGCYDESRYASRDEMIDEIMSVFDAPAFRDGAPALGHSMSAPDPIFEPLAFRNLQVKNQVLRSNIAGRSTPTTARARRRASTGS